ncbi:MAG: 5-bromo-4-chloroindolyl phosphate hydrolysis family protein [Clostridiales bacterium]|nr:5-bromo-4-chloroindolyl phosphate hydrolysis family protein [Clostridiales bacterium]
MKKEIRKKSVVPVYALAVVWLLYALFLPLYKLWHFILLAVIAAVVYLVFSKMFPGKIVTIEQPKNEETGNPEVDAVVREGKLAMKEMGRLYSSIDDPVVKKRIVEIMDISDKIVKDAISDPKDIPNIKRFLNYYLPTTIKLLNAYDRMSVQGIEGENISGTITRIEDMLDTIVASYKKQLDSLFADEAMDIETDIKVMDGLLQREGLKDKEI